MFDSHVLTFTGLALLLTIAPGPDTLLVIRNVLSHGPRIGLVTTFGICCGLFVHAALSAAGLSVILVHSAAAFEIVKYFGAAYLLFLGGQALWDAVRNPIQGAEMDAPQTPSRFKPARVALLEGLLSNVLNPKTALFYLAFLPQFIMPGDPVWLKSIMLACIHFGLGILWLALVALGLGRIRFVFAHPAIHRRLKALTGAVLIAFGVRLALEHRS